MKLLKYLFFLYVGITMLSCVGEDVVFSGTDSNNISFNRKLTSVAFDETPKIVLRKANKEVNLDDLNFNVLFSSSNTDFLEIDDKGVLFPKESGLGKDVTIKISFASKEPTTTEEIPATIEDVLTIGKVTISESEAINIPENELNKIIAEGYTPKVVINETIEEIDIDTTEEFKLTAFYQNSKNDVEETTFIWESSDTEVLTIDENGVLKPIKIGDAIIKVSALLDGKIVASAEKPIKVSENTVVVDPNPDSGKTTVGFGTLQTNSSYPVSGKFQIFTENGKTFISVDDAFEAKGVPDLTIYFSNSTTSNGGSAKLVAAPETGLKPSGAQTFEVPTGISPNDFSNVLLYCRRFGIKVGFGVINR